MQQHDIQIFYRVGKLLRNQFRQQRTVLQRREKEFRRMIGDDAERILLLLLQRISHHLRSREHLNIEMFLKR